MPQLLLTPVRSSAQQRLQRAGLLRRALFALLALALSATVLPMCRASAQFLEPDEALKNNRGEVVRILREDKSVPPAQQQMFEDFFRRYALPQFAMQKNLLGLPKIRKDYRIYFTQAQGANGAAHALLNKISLEKFNEMLRIKPAADASDQLRSQISAIKFNVIMAVGDLNDQEQGVGVKVKPYGDALTLLLKIFSAKAADGATTGAVDMLRFGALTGIQRHAEAELLPSESRAKIEAAMLAVVKQKQPPAGRDAKTNDALRRRAIETLEIADRLQPNAAVVRAIVTVLADSDESVKLRSAPVDALGGFKYTTDFPVDLKSIVDEIGRFAAESTSQELQAALRDGVPPSKRRLKTWSRIAREGLGEPTKPNSLVAVAGEEAQRVFAKVRAIDTVLDDPKVSEEALAKVLTERLKDLENVLPPRGANQRVAPKEPAAPPAGKKTVGGQRERVSREPAGRPLQRVEPVSADVKADLKADGTEPAQQ